VEDVRAAAVHAMEASAQEAAAMRESAVTLIEEVEDWAALAERRTERGCQG
jgi:hypothetical protein